MIKPHIIVRGQFQPDDLCVTFSEQSSRRIDPNVEQQVDALWEQMIVDAKERGITIWNGITYRADSVVLKPNGKLVIDFSTIDFKARECLPRAIGYFSLPEDCYRRGAYTGAFVITSDGWYIFVELSQKSANQKRYDVIGGIIDEELPVRSGHDLFTSFYKELYEEGAIPEKSVSDCELRLIFLDGMTNVGFQFVVHLHDTRSDVEERFQTTQRDPDVKALCFVKQSQVNEFAEVISDSKALAVHEIFG